MNNSTPALLYKKIPIPEAFITEDENGRWGGDIRIGDLTGNGVVDFLVYKSLGGMKPCFLGAFTLDGEPLWSVGDKQMTAADVDSTEPTLSFGHPSYGDSTLRHHEDSTVLLSESGVSVLSEGTLRTTSPDRPGPVAICDIDGDGVAEVICFLIDASVKGTSRWRLDGIDVVALDGRTGGVKQQAAPLELRRCNGYADGELHLSNYVHQRLMIANLSGNAQPQDFVVKVGNDLLAFNHRLELLWRYTNRWYRYPTHSAYIPAVGDLDGDGRDEVHGGHYGLDHDGSVLWEKYLGDNMDAVLVEDWGSNESRQKVAIMSGWGQVVDAHGNTLLKLGAELVPHGQEIRCGDFRKDLPGPALVIRYNGHRPDLMVVSHTGQALCQFVVEESPNNTGLETVRWNGVSGPDLIYSPAALYDGYGRKRFTFPELPPPKGGRMGWYHCFPANVCGDDREEVVLYDPYSDEVYIYTPQPLVESAYSGYRHTSRQYNARLMD